MESLRVRIDCMFTEENSGFDTFHITFRSLDDLPDNTPLIFEFDFMFNDVNEIVTYDYHVLKLKYSLN